VLGDIDLRGPFDDATRAELHRALLEWKVTFFRDQHLSGPEHRDFAPMGELEAPPAPGEVPEVVRFERASTRRAKEHLAQRRSWREVLSLGSVLRAIEAPSGGDTSGATCTP
jgi:taurine dioxygenase